jgi:hypothetical protein
MNAKPILIVRFPYDEKMPYTKYMEHISSHDLTKEYHVLFLKENNRDQVGFEVFNVSDHDPVRMGQLEKLVIDSFTN